MRSYATRTLHARSEYHTQLANYVTFDESLDLTPEGYFYLLSKMESGRTRDGVWTARTFVYPFE